ncbi:MULTISPECIES: aminotransferase class V-fold PLP-dependent enzyme [unclassified Chitinophaga]|uniref:aminotransferase class V-fold PLP-dependent enzyme n=1 Tax=unclassified Chitinophaga TaxID=2619133 RepID=UPI0009D3A3DD|nr:MULTISPECIES: aminotransferase class V-fold PLP-dependent enzyme [unclassified Chitinophaga]OMP80808.1 selenocysteine synthase [[Flexibacter] sp. ATCC 35208]WPV70053.1 aminotransferase class V-fold PLP-dependent enzyme [Chitinophaga sp. LS1]
MNRRDLLKNMSVIPVFGAFAGSANILPLTDAAAPAVAKDYFKDLGIRTFINAAGTYTAMTGSLMRPEVMNAINYASKDFVLLDELQDKVGARIAELLKCEYATVTSGCASAMTLGAAGVLTGMDEKKVAQLPHLEGTGMKTEVIIQRKHDIAYAHALKNTGLKIVYVDTKEELISAITDKTALMYFLNANNFDGPVQVEEFLKIAQAHNIPTMIDCAADVPPVENLWKYTNMGYDLVCFSGGKGIRGPQSAGLLLGRKKYIQAARLSAPPRGNTIGRGLKVNKEEILGMLIALETYLATDHDKEWKMWEAQIKLIGDAATSVGGVTTTVKVPAIANHVPTLHVSWDAKKIPATAAELKEKLRSGSPSIEIADGETQHAVAITTWMLVPGQEKIVAAALKKALTEKALSETHG